jgi:hypothetical protein
MKTSARIKARLRYLRGEIEKERISYGEISELQDLAKYIEPGDVLLLEWAGVPERTRGKKTRSNPGWSKKHFVTIAEVLAVTRKNMKKAGRGNDAYAALDAATEAFSAYFESVAPNFDTERFDRAAMYYMVPN